VRLGERVDLRSRLVGELRRTDGGRVLDLPPDRVAHAVRRVLGLPGAGIVMMDRLVRLPVAASGPYVPEAEQVQVTLGHGPCMTAAALNEPLVSSEAELVERWPMYHAGLVSRTPFRSTLTLPLARADGHVFAALDAYGTDPELDLRQPLAVVQAAVGPIVAMLLLGALTEDEHLLVWPATEQLRQRQQVWLAVGMVVEAARITDLDALAILRGYAFRTDLLLDAVVDELVKGGLTTRQVLAAA
jgi:hypothetical protein